MISISAVNLTKKSKHYAIKGGNGVGKSTLMKMLCGFLSPSGGSISYSKADKIITRNQIFKSISIAAPYATIVQDFTLKENFEFISKFKTIDSSIDYKNLISLLEWKDPKEKLISQFSSGMQQKVNVCFAFIAQSDLLFLDEPTSFMDAHARIWYKKMYENYTMDRTTIIASNDDFDFKKEAITIPLS
jgi:ABC-type multidrug transport system ATPase subunit